MTVEMWIREEAEIAEEKGHEDERETMVATIRRIKAGETPEAIISDGVDPKTVEAALNCIS